MRSSRVISSLLRLASMTLPSLITMSAPGEMTLRIRGLQYCATERRTFRPRSVDALTNPARSELSPALSASEMLSDMMSRRMRSNGVQLPELMPADDPHDDQEKEIDHGCPEDEFGKRRLENKEF